MSLSLSLALSFPLSSQSDHIVNSSGHILPSDVHIAQYLECSAIFAGAVGEVGEDMDRVSISWLPCIGARLVLLALCYILGFLY